MNNYLKNRVFLVLAILLFSGCQTISHSYISTLETHKTLYLDPEFPDYNDVIVESQAEIFEIDDEMKQMVKYVLRKEKDDQIKAKLLLEYIFSSNHIAMSYEPYTNVTAIDAFHGKKANCMSLTIMAYALGKEAGLSLKFQDIEVPEYWVRNGTHQLLMGHVNLLIVRRPLISANAIWVKEILQIDFDPGAVKKHFPRKVVTKDTITAMFYNNKAAEAILLKDFNKAYAYLKEATKIDPLYSSAWGNLGVLYKMTGHLNSALNTYQYALKLNPNDYTALENLSLVFDKLGNYEEADNINAILHARRTQNPHYHALLADEASFEGNNDLAISHLRKAIKISPKFHEFHYNLAKLYFKTEQIELAQSAIKKALKLNKNFSTEVKYNQKLSFLNQASVSYTN